MVAKQDSDEFMPLTLDVMKINAKRSENAEAVDCPTIQPIFQTRGYY